VVVRSFFLCRRIVSFSLCESSIDRDKSRFFSLFEGDRGPLLPSMARSSLEEIDGTANGNHILFKGGDSFPATGCRRFIGNEHVEKLFPEDASLCQELVRRREWT